MYQGFSKESGSVVGIVEASSASMDLSEVQETTGAEEALLGCDQEGNEVAILAQIDPNTGDLDWIPTYDVDSVKRKTVAMSQMGSMLRDKDRNAVYEQALQQMISSLVRQIQRPPVVLDVGAGTGLLSLLSAKHGAAQVYGVEMFDSMAHIAAEVVLSNGCVDQVHIINAKSTAIEALPVPADLLVSELLDSALFGEAVLPTHADAINRLLRHPLPVGLEDRVIPNRAEVFCSLVESWEVHAQVDVCAQRCGLESFNMHRDEDARHCHGACAALPVHWEALEHRGARVLSSAACCLKTNFWQPHSPSADGAEVREASLSVWESEVVAEGAGTVTALLMWWNVFLLPLALDPLQRTTYSTKPGAQNWQDHWQQVVFPLCAPVACNAGDAFKLQLVHDGVGLWAFADPIPAETRSVIGTKRGACSEPRMRTAVPRRGEERYLRPDCSCGWHLLCSPQRLLMMADQQYNSIWGSAMEEAIAITMSKEMQLALDLSDGSHLALMAALAARRLCPNNGLCVVSREQKQFSRIFFDQIVAANGLEDRLMLWDGLELESIVEHFNCDGEHCLTDLRFGLLMSDCRYYQLHALPTWQALSFYYQRRAFTELLHPQAIIMPARALIMVALVELQDLNISHGPVGIVSGFDHSALDAAQANWHDYLYPYHLANYRKKMLSRPVRLAVLDYYTLSEQFDTVLQQTTQVTATGRCDCMVVWVDYEIDKAGRSCLSHFNGEDFVPFASQSLKFIPRPLELTCGMHVGIAMALPQGSSDFQFEIL